MTVTSTTLFSNSFKAVRDLLIDNLTDIKGRFKTSIIRSSRQFSSATDFSGYPYVVVNPPSIIHDNPSNDGTIKDTEFTIDIEVISESTDDLDDMSDSIQAIFNSNTHRNTLLTKRLEIVDMSGGDGTRDFIEGNEVFIRTFILSVRSRLDVTN